MFLRNYPSLFVLIYLIFVKSTAVNGIIDPITGTLAIGAFVAGYFMHKSNYDIPLFSKCPKTVDIYGELNYKRNCQLFFFLPI